MIKSLSLSNFKSIGKTLIVNDKGEPVEGKLEFKPLTIFCGKNSSGKSTVLQSILLLAQTLQSNMPSQTFLLNGPMVKLGSMDDIISDFTHSNNKNIKIDMNVDLSKAIEEITKFSSLEENIKRVFVKNISQYYYISNSIQDIKDTLNENLFECFLDLDNRLSDDKWVLNNKLNRNIKDVMNKYNLNYSARVWRGRNNYEYELEVHKRTDNKWFSIYFNINKYVYIKNKTNNVKSINDKYNMLNFVISFSKDNLIDISNISPIINTIHIGVPDFCEFTALYRQKPKDMILKYNRLV